MTALPMIGVACATQGCRASGAVRRIRLHPAAPGFVTVPPLACTACGRPPRTVQDWPPAEGTDMPKITVHGGPSNAAEPQTAGPAETPPPPADPVAGHVAPSDSRSLFDPGAHTVAEVQEYLQAASEQGDTGEVGRVLEAERAGKARKSLLAGS